MTHWVIKENYIQQASQNANIFGLADPQGRKRQPCLNSSGTTISEEENSRGSSNIAWLVICIQNSGCQNETICIKLSTEPGCQIIYNNTSLSCNSNFTFTGLDCLLQNTWYTIIHAKLLMGH